MAFDADTKLIVSLAVEDRSRWAATFMGDLASRFSRLEQLTTDGHPAYPLRRIRPMVESLVGIHHRGDCGLRRTVTHRSIPLRTV